MRLCIDVGNTTIELGFFEKDKLLNQVKISTKNLTPDEFAVALMQQMFAKGINNYQVDEAIMSSVVPEINYSFKQAIKTIFHVEKIVGLNPGIKTGLPIHTDHPNEVGNDLVAASVAAKEIYGYPTIIADLGTATKLLVIDKNGAFISGVIMPGLAISKEALIEKASLLPEISLDTPKSVLAKNTIDSMNTGLVYGHSEMVLGLMKKMEKELGYECKHILTGGNALPLLSLLEKEFIFDETLVLKGLNLIFNRNKEVR